MQTYDENSHVPATRSHKAQSTGKFVALSSMSARGADFTAVTALRMIGAFISVVNRSMALTSSDGPPKNLFSASKKLFLRG